MTIRCQHDVRTDLCCICNREARVVSLPKNRCVNCGGYVKRIFRRKYCEACRMSLEILRRRRRQANNKVSEPPQ